jgi:hypothetical protein
LVNILLFLINTLFTFNKQTINNITTNKQFSQSVNSMTTKELQILRSKMPKGYRQRIQEKTGLSLAMIDYVFMGLRTNQSVLVAAVEILEEYNREQEEFQARLRKAMENQNL